MGEQLDGGYGPETRWEPCRDGCGKLRPKGKPCPHCKPCDVCGARLGDYHEATHKLKGGKP